MNYTDRVAKGAAEPCCCEICQKASKEGLKELRELQRLIRQRLEA